MANNKLSFPERIERLRETSDVLHELARTCHTPEIAEQLSEAADTVRLEVWAMEKAAQRFTQRGSRRPKSKAAA
jgi:hypothetical protein